MEFQLKRTKAVWQYIVDYTIEHRGIAPSVRDFIHGGVDGITSTSIVETHLEKLEEMNLITRYHGASAMARTIEIVGGIYALPINVRDNKEPHEYSETIYPRDRFGLVTRILVFLKQETVLSQIVVATDNKEVKMVAIAFGMPVISKTMEEWKVEEANPQTAG